MFKYTLFQKKMNPAFLPGIVLKAVFCALIISAFFFEIDRKAPPLLSTSTALASDCVVCDSQSGGPLEIPSTGQAVGLPLTIDGTEVIGKVILELNIEHTSISDLMVILKSPQGTESLMFDGICSCEDDMMIVLDDDAPDPVGTQCGSPYTGTFNTGGGLDAFIGEIPMGTWELFITDYFQTDHGKLVSATLYVLSGDCEGKSIEDVLYPIPTVGQTGLVLVVAFLAFLGLRGLKNR